MARHTRFGMGGSAAVFAETNDPALFVDGLKRIRRTGVPLQVVGGGTNLIVDDAGFCGVVMRFCGRRLLSRLGVIDVEAGVELQRLVDCSIDAGLHGLHTLTRIPGWVGAAIYGNAGAYGHSIHEFVESVRYFDGEQIVLATRDECQFAYRESIFKRRKDWTILSATLRLPKGNRDEVQARADEIRKIRDAKYPPEMRCAGSIFKNLLLAELNETAGGLVPGQVVIEGKVPAGWFLEQVGAKGMRRGDIQVAGYHGNLIYNDGNGSSADFYSIVDELKRRVRETFSVELEEEVQYIPERDPK